VNDPSPLCRACALCCDGTLFSHGSVRPSEREQCARLGLTVLPSGGERSEGGLRFLQPCPRLSACDCTAYDGRPQACRDFVCRLARAFEEGEVSLAEALQLVQGVRQQMAALEALLPPLLHGARERLQARVLAAPRTEALADQLAALEKVLDRRFRGSAR
jgi:uncharacterized protein